MGIKKIDSRTIFGFKNRRPDLTQPDPTRPDPSDKKEGREIDSFEGNLNKNIEFRKCFAKSSVLAGVLGPKMSKFYGTSDSRFPLT